MQSKRDFLFKILFVALDRTLFPILLTWTRTLPFTQLLAQLPTHSRGGWLWACPLTRTPRPVCHSWQAFRWRFQLMQLHSSRQITISSLSFRNEPSISFEAFICVFDHYDSNVKILKEIFFIIQKDRPWINKAQNLLTLLGHQKVFFPLVCLKSDFWTEAASSCFPLVLS